MQETSWQPRALSPLSSESFANGTKPAPAPGHWAVRKKEGWRGDVFLPGICVLSRQADVTGQMAQWLRRSLTTLKLSIHFQNRFGLSESRPHLPHTKRAIYVANV